MTAAEWKAYFRDSRPGVAASLDVTDVLRDLAGCEAERDLEKLNGDVISTIREELHERYGEECTFFDDAVHHVLAKLEAERDKALEVMDIACAPVDIGGGGRVAASDMFRRMNVAEQSRAALEADRDSWKAANAREAQSCAEYAAENEHLRDREEALVEETAQLREALTPYLHHINSCSKGELILGGTFDNPTKRVCACTCGLDALLAKLGGKP